jgi:uncharacterized protein
MAAVFSVYAVAISWICWVPVAASARGIGEIPASAEPLLVVLGTLGPFLAAASLVSRTAGFKGLRSFLAPAFRWRVPIWWYLAALFLPAGLRLMVLWIHIRKGGHVSGLDDVSRWMAMPITFVMVLFIGGPTGEEFGWRGFLLQRTQPVYGMVWASVLIGVIACIWHIPLFFIPGTAQSHIPYALFAVRTVALSIISTWLYNGSRRSLLIVLLFHASLNTWPNTLYILETEGTLGPYISTTILYVGWASLLIILGLLHGRGDRRRRRESSLAAAA